MKTKRILLLQFMLADVADHDGLSILFPFGLGYVARYLADAGYDVEVLDAHALQWDLDVLLRYVFSKQYDLIGISASAPQYALIKKAAQRMKAHSSIPLVLGGPLATYSWGVVLKNTQIDYCVVGEGELTTVDLLRNLDTPERVKGIAYSDAAGRAVRTAPRGLLTPLDDLRPPAYDHFDMSQYIDEKQSFSLRRFKQVSRRTLNYVASRGCFYDCAFCARQFDRYRSFSVERIISDIRFLRDRYAINNILFADMLFIRNKGMLKKVAQELRELDVTWYCQARVDMLDEESLDILKSSGCQQLSLGIESGSQLILDNMNKRFKTGQSLRILRHAVKIGLPVKMHLIFGYPGENEQTMKETVEFFRKVRVPLRPFYLITPFPGSRLYQDSLREGMIADEDEFLERLGGTLWFNKLLLNYTNWTDEQLLDKKRELEGMIKRDYYDPFRILKSLLMRG